MSDHGGPPITFRQWARIVYDRLRADLPEIHAAGTGRSVTISRGSERVVLKNDGAVWWVLFTRGERSPMPPLEIERHDPATATNVAKTAAGFFDARLSRPARGPGASPEPPVKQ